MELRIDPAFRFVSEDFILFDDIRDFDPSEAGGEWIAVLFCERGRFDIELNGIRYSVGPNDILCCPPKAIVRKLASSSDFKGRLVGLSERLCRDIFPNSAKIWHQVFRMRRRCKATLSEAVVADLFIDWEYFKRRVVERDNSCYADVMRCLVQSLLYRFSDIMEREVETVDTREPMRSKECLSQAFFDLLASSAPKRRTVRWYADRLHKSSKYLSVAVRQTSGKTPSEWIHRAVAIEIADLLKNSPKSIKEICDELEFPSLSFFGRYVRERLGVSPTEYRRRNRNAADKPVMDS